MLCIFLNVPRISFIQLVDWVSRNAEPTSDILELNVKNTSFGDFLSAVLWQKL